VFLKENGLKNIFYKKIPLYLLAIIVVAKFYTVDEMSPIKKKVDNMLFHF
jgi:hypothetical protein